MSEQQWGAAPGWEQHAQAVQAWQVPGADNPWMPVEQNQQQALPVEGRQYHEFWRGPKNRWWMALLGLIAFWVAWVVIGAVLSAAATAIDSANGVVQERGKIKVTPALFLANNLGLAAFIPLAMLLGWAFSGQRPKWMSSVEGGIRWRWLRRAAIFIVPLWVFYLGGLQLLGGFHGLHSNRATVLMIVGILLTTPLQCAGEEYALRGFMTRVVGSWIPHRVVGLIVSALVSAGVFTFLHNAQDIYLNIFYFCFALTGSYLAWRTGGLEAGIVLHVINNLLAEATLPWSDFSNMFDRSAGASSPWGLVQVVFCLFAIGLVEIALRRKRDRPRQETAPGNAIVDAELLRRQRSTAPARVGIGPVASADPYGGQAVTGLYASQPGASAGQSAPFVPPAAYAHPAPYAPQPGGNGPAAPYVPPAGPYGPPPADGHPAYAPSAAPEPDAGMDRGSANPGDHAAGAVQDPYAPLPQDPYAPVDPNRNQHPGTGPEGPTPRW